MVEKLYYILQIWKHFSSSLQLCLIYYIHEQHSFKKKYVFTSKVIVIYREEQTERRKLRGKERRRESEKDIERIFHPLVQFLTQMISVCDRIEARSQNLHLRLLHGPKHLSHHPLTGSWIRIVINGMYSSTHMNARNFICYTSVLVPESNLQLHIYIYIW